ncbi:MAG TPA: lipoprotein [Albitalea sp.]|uniref:LPS translocon maturation chaperone LptM n=1 Tax=Piscinibacter sp. TaxID=1903157 RepID=UPI002ED60B3C
MYKRHHSLARSLVAMTAAGSLLIALSLVSGCGQKGPLTLAKPKAATPASSALPASSPASAP